MIQIHIYLNLDINKTSIIDIEVLLFYKYSSINSLRTFSEALNVA